MSIENPENLYKTPEEDLTANLGVDTESADFLIDDITTETAAAVEAADKAEADKLTAEINQETTKEILKNTILELLTKAKLKIETKNLIKNNIVASIKAEPKLRDPETLTQVLTETIQYAEQIEGSVDNDEIGGQIAESLEKTLRA